MMMGSNGKRLLTIGALIFVCFLNGLSWQAAATTHTADFNALQALFQHWSSKPGNNMPGNWVGNDPCGSLWIGIECDESSTSVQQLTLINFDLAGTIPAAIGGLGNLLSLDLSDNPNLGGTIPPELFQLTKLTHLALMNCGLSGSINDVGKLVHLNFLALNQNSLTGTIPAAIGNLVNMTWFDISQNSISGSLPVATANSLGLDNLTLCLHFHFYNNALNGTIPAQIFNLPQLMHMLLSFNNLQGPIPSTTLANAQSLSILSLDHNSLTGSVPSQLNSITSLTQLHLSDNGFTKTLPDLSALTKLEFLDVSYNKFDLQVIPTWTYLLTSAQTIGMAGSNLNGSLDSSIFSLPAIQSLYFSNNSLTGTVSFTNFSKTLQTVDLQYNQFDDLSAASNGNIVPIWLHGNPLCKENIYSGLNACEQVTNTPVTWVAPPNPSCSRSCGGGQTLNPNFCSCDRPLVCLMELTSPSFTNVTSAVVTNLGNEVANKFIELSRISNDGQVYIGGVNFTEDSKMLFFLSFFPLPGTSLNDSTVTYIKFALSAQTVTLSVGPYILKSSTAPASSHGKKKSSTGLVVGVVVAVVIVAFIIALIALYAIRQKRRADKADGSRPFASWGTMAKDSGEAPELKGARWFSLAELKKATDNFSESNEIGAGGYGKVYRAVLPNGKVVAVKRAEEGSVQGAVEFKNEIELLSRVHHKNLVGLVGFCYEQGEQALVYEYISNGTVREHLLGYYEKPLSWDMRVAIALGSARGLTYLHELANPPIIHRDIKSGNILLDEKMTAKVADFGLSKLAPDGADKPHVSTQVKGTLGYLDPEYYMTNQLSEKSDVYSFGVVLLEMLSARPPIERGRYIVREVRTALNKGGIKGLEPMLDPFLGDYPPKQLKAFLDLALLCVQEVAKGRPTMNEVVKKLEVIAGHSQPQAGVHITVEPQKEDGLYEKDYLKGLDDRSFQYSGASFTANAPVEPK